MGAVSRLCFIEDEVAIVKQGYTVKLVARNEGIEYRDELDVYRFNVGLTDGKWKVYLPGSKGENYQAHELTVQEKTIILPRIAKYLESRKYFGFFGPTYPVILEEEGSVSTAVAASRQRGSQFWERRK